ncbi:hypothetical protein DRJ22_03740 [Candidatus Woesearchaeota archaeon]|nr:MAG: hypothetical protein DRJ22_03740 [Candidatus Woesearchaeota archaeon]
MVKIKLQEKEIENFFKLHKSLMFYVNKKKGVIKEWSNPEHVSGSLKKVHKLREFVVKDFGLIDSFIEENPFNFISDELKTIESWKKGIYGEFFIVKYDKGFTYFYHSETKKCYGVLSLYEQLEDMLGPYLPIMVEAWLIPYKRKIIYDSFILPYRISFGGGMRRSLKAEYEEAIIRHGFITSFDGTSEEKETSDEELLKFYMKSETNRDRFWKEIENLSRKNPKLEKVYYQELGRINSREIKKALKANGVKNSWFAVLGRVTIASGKNKKELLDNVSEVLPEDKKEHIFVFKV